MTPEVDEGPAVMLYVEVVARKEDVSMTCVHVTEIEPECGYEAMIDW